MSKSLIQILQEQERPSKPLSSWKTGDVINEEHGHKIGDPELVAAVCDSAAMDAATWNALSFEDQVAHQLGFVEY